MNISIEYPVGWQSEEYALLDSGNDYKLERFGRFLLVRPDPQALWQRSLLNKDWEQADATFTKEKDGEDEGNIAKSAHWSSPKTMPESWPVHWDNLALLARLSPFKHTGIFPEQSGHWQWLQQRIRQQGHRQVRMLNLFGYTGAASIVAARAGASVTHVDASPKSIDWAKQNQDANDLQQAPIRWIVDDALKFVHREARRESRYDIIMLDPPSFGRGAKGEVWKFETSLPELLGACRDILSSQPLGILLTSYSIRASSILLGNMLDDMLGKFRYSGTISVGELALQEQSRNRSLSTAIFARWEP